MRKVMLVCNAGMSTGIMAKKIEEASEGNLEVTAYGEAEFEDHLEGVEMILVGPQIRYLVPNIQAKVSCPVDSIAPQHYGVMNGKAVYQQIIDRIGA
ncbi:PTS sugar transporter subunit IIB [Enorma massiliensis]|uniref:PTS sugar transporter subunit IIB n=1 Tax=Enorma massiliensis TaxID=1472761 RepID=UPI00195D5F6D|nr:PTS sugar transporter subunit IIB [Enorma massiliensis]MBM6784332.1 PTS sugar transporter subunit IIB [Enorma massiliensis]